MHKLRGWDGQLLSYNVCSVAFGSQEKGTMIGVSKDCPSDSPVLTHGATSVPSMPAFSGNTILLYYFPAASPIISSKYWIRLGLLPQLVGLPILP